MRKQSKAKAVPRKIVVAPEPKFRAMQDVQIEYQNVCMRVGELVYRHSEIPNEVEKLKRRQKELCDEADAITAYETEKKKREEEAKAAEAKGAGENKAKETAPAPATKQ